MSRSSLTHALTHSLTPPPLPSKANQLSSLSEWKQHARVYATIVTQGSAIAHDATSGTPRTQGSARSSRPRTWRASLEAAEPHSVSAPHCARPTTTTHYLLTTACRCTRQRSARTHAPPATRHPPPACVPPQVRATILEELKQLDQRLQGVHPSFAYALQETVSPVHAAPCLRLLRDVRARALAINLQVVWHFHLPEAARRLLPRRAGSLLPRPIAEALHGVTPGTPRAALDALAAKLMARLEVTRAAPADAAQLLERVERAALCGYDTRRRVPAQHARRPTDWPRLAEAWGSPRHEVAQRERERERASEREREQRAESSELGAGS